MEHLFSPCTRLQDIFESQGQLEEIRRRRPEPLQERNLDVSTEELLSAERAFTYADLYAMLGIANTVAWLTPHAAVAREHSGLAAIIWDSLDESESYCFSFSADGKDVIAYARSSEHLLEICDIVLRLLALSVVQSVNLFDWTLDDELNNAPTLAYLMEQCHSLKALTLKNLEIDEHHIRVLGAYSRPDLEIVLKHCKITSAGASALAEVLGRNQGPTKLDYCGIDNSALAGGLRGNSRLKSLKPRFPGNRHVSNREVLAIAGALKENKGLVRMDLSFYGLVVNDETWGTICDSLGTHPTLEVLDLRTMGGMSLLAPAMLTPRIQTLLDMVKMNTTIHSIYLNSLYSQHELFRESVIPYLGTNRLRPRLLAIQKTRPIPYRAKVLGRALLSARTNANSFWMLLSGNVEVAFASATASLTTPATSAATSTENVAAVTASVMFALTTTVTGSFPTAAAATTSATSAVPPFTASASDTCAPAVAAVAAAVANGATTPAGQKRKARP
jgi:hypothetical protein